MNLFKQDGRDKYPFMPLAENGVIMSRDEYVKLKDISMTALCEFFNFYKTSFNADEEKDMVDIWIEFLKLGKEKFPLTVLPPDEVVHMDVDLYAEKILFGIVPPRLRYLFGSDDNQGDYVTKTRVGIASEYMYFFQLD